MGGLRDTISHFPVAFYFTEGGALHFEIAVCALQLRALSRFLGPIFSPPQEVFTQRFSSFFVLLYPSLWDKAGIAPNVPPRRRRGLDRGTRLRRGLLGGGGPSNFPLSDLGPPISKVRSLCPACVHQVPKAGRCVQPGSTRFQKYFRCLQRPLEATTP